MNREQKHKASHLRQEMNALWTKMGSLLEEFQKREPLVKGTLYERRRRCGREGCRCSRGAPHVSLAFCLSEEGQTKHPSLRDIEPERLRGPVESYRRFRAARAELTKTWSAFIESVDEMESLRKVEWNALVHGAGSKIPQEDD
jgi:hypothetical protein